MPDNLPGSEGAPQSPSPSPGSGKKSPSGRVVVTLSSVAKMAPPNLVESGVVVAPPKLVPPLADHAPRGSILPAKETVAATHRRLTIPQEKQPQLNRTMEVKLPPKSGVLPKMTSLANMPISPAGTKTGNLPPVTLSPQSGQETRRTTPPPLPAKAAVEPKAPRKSLLPFRLKPFSFGARTPEESIFPDAKAEPTPAAENPPGWKHLEPGELPTPPGGLQSLAAFADNQRALEAAKAKSTDSLVLPSAAPEPPPLPEEKPSSAVHAVPPLMGGVAPAPVEKFRLPPPLFEAKKDVAVAKAPAMLDSGATSHVSSPITVGPAIAHVPLPSARPAATPPPLPVKTSVAPIESTATPPRLGKLAFIPELPEKVSTPPPVLPSVTPAAPAPASGLEFPPLPATKLPTVEPAAPTPVSSVEKFAPLPVATGKLPPVTPASPVEKFQPLPGAASKVPPVAAPSVVEKVEPPSIPVAEVLTVPPTASVPPAVEKSEPPPKVEEKSGVEKPPLVPPPIFVAPPIVESKAPPLVTRTVESPAASSPKLRPPTLPRANKPPEVEKAVPILAPVDPMSDVILPAVLTSVVTGAVAENEKLNPPAKKDAPALAKTGVISSSPPVPEITVKAPTTRSARAKKRRLVSTVLFYLILIAGIGPLLYLMTIHFSTETRLEGQVIPPTGTLLNNEVWIVTDFHELASGIADDLAAERAPKLQEIQERQDHVQRAQADIAAREERIRLLQEQVQAAKDEIASVIKDAHDAAQKVWDGPGAGLQDEYKSRLSQLGSSIAARAKSLNLPYTPDPAYQSPEVWANAYRLALYQTPPGVDGVKEHQWIEDQLKQWRDFTKSVDDRQQKLRQQAAQIQLSPTPRVTELNGKIDDLQHRIDSTLAEEEPLKTELQQAQTDLVQSQTAEAGLDAKYYTQLDALPETNISKRLPMLPNGRFSWSHLEKDSPFAEDEKTHNYWLFARAVRPDGRQYWALTHFSISENSIMPMLIQPSTFVSTKAILRPDLPPDEQQ